MANIKITIQHNNVLYEPPIEEGVKIEWERLGSPGKLTFTTILPSGSNLFFTEGDPVCFYYDDKLVFVGYVFTKKHDKERKIQVTCYDQLRYLKNKFSYVFENKTATEIVKALCDDFKLTVGELDDTKYVIPAIAEENKSALDILLTVFEETLLNTGDMFVLFDDAGKLTLKNSANMVSSTLVYTESAEDFDFTSSIDEETYNQVILYYKQGETITQIYTASSPTTIKQWGILRYFEEVKTPTIGQNKANSLLKLYNRKTRQLKVSGAFGDISVRGGTLIPVQLDLDETLVNNYMVVEKVTHLFNKDYYTMDLTLDGAWKDPEYEVESKTIGELIAEEKASNLGGTATPSLGAETETETEAENTQVWLKFTANIRHRSHIGKDITIRYFKSGKYKIEKITISSLGAIYKSILCDTNKPISIIVCAPLIYAVPGESEPFVWYGDTMLRGSLTKRGYVTIETFSEVPAKWS